LRLPALCLTALLLTPAHLAGQMSVVTMSDSLMKRIRPGSCPLADAMLGPASKQVLKADLHGYFRTDSSYLVISGPMIIRNEMPREMVIAAGTAGNGTIPSASLTLFLARKVMDADLQHASPFTLIVDDTTSIPLGMPVMPAIQGYAPPSVPIHVDLSAAAVRALLGARKARAEFVGTRTVLSKDNLTDMAATARAAICFRSGQELSRE
jgi:hypothetical protein